MATVVQTLSQGRWKRKLLLVIYHGMKTCSLQRSWHQWHTACSHPVSTLVASFRVFNSERTLGSKVTSEYLFCDLKRCLVWMFARGSIIVSLLWSFEYLDSTYNPEISGFNILKHPRNVKCYKLVSSLKNKKKSFLSFKGFPFPWLRPFPSGFCIMNISRGWLTTVSSETHLSKPRMCAMQRKKNPIENEQKISALTIVPLIFVYLGMFQCMQREDKMAICRTWNVSNERICIPWKSPVLKLRMTNDSLSSWVGLIASPLDAYFCIPFIPRDSYKVIHSEIYIPDKIWQVKKI